MLINNIGLDDVLTRFGRWFNRQRDVLGYPQKSIERRLEETGIYYPVDGLHSYMKVPKERRLFKEILIENKPMDFEIAEAIVFNEYFPRSLFHVVYAKYFIFSANGKRVTDKDRWESLNINNKPDFYAHIRVAHKIIEEKWEIVKKQILDKNRIT